MAPEEKLRIYKKEWARKKRAEDPEASKKEQSERSKKMYDNNPEKYRERAAEFRKENPEYVKIWWGEHKEKAREYRKKYKEKRAAYNKEWRSNHPGETLAHKHNRRTRETEAGGYFTAQEWFLLCFAAGFKCLCCGEKKPLTPDHVIPVSKGGTSWLHNIQPLCRPCNSAKHTKTVDFRIPEEDRLELANNKYQRIDFVYQS